MNKKSNKKGITIWVVVIVILIAIVGVIIGLNEHRKANELKLSNANNTLTELATETGLVDKSEGAFYITLYVTAGIIVIAGVAVFIYVYKKADE